MSVCCECCVLSGRGLCDELITRPEESYRLWCVVLCDQETSRTRKPWPVLRRSVTGKEKTSKTNWLLYLPPALPFCISAPYPHNAFISSISYSEQRSNNFPYSIDSLILLTEIVCVFFEVESEISYLFEIFHSRTMIHAVSRQPLISAVRVQSQTSTCRICDVQSGTGTDFSPSISILP